MRGNLIQMEKLWNMPRLIVIDEHKISEFKQGTNATENKLRLFSPRKVYKNCEQDSWPVYRFANVHIFTYGVVNIIRTTLRCTVAEKFCWLFCV